MSIAKLRITWFDAAVGLTLLLFACSGERREPEVPAAAEPRPTLAARTYDEPAPPQAPAPVTVQQSRTSIVISKEVTQTCNLPDQPEDAPQFDFDRSVLRPRGASILDVVARCMTDGALQDRDVIVTGFADPLGTEEYNLALGMRRANAAKDYLIGQHVPPERIKVRSRGETDARGTDPTTWQLDRRAEVEEAPGSTNSR